MPTPTQQEITKAKKLLNKRVDLQTQATNALKEEIRKAFAQVAELGYGSDIAPLQFRFSNMKDCDELKELLANLRVATFLLAEHAAQEAAQLVQDAYGIPISFDVGEYMNRVIDDKTMKERIATYSHRLFMEWETWVAAGLITGLTLKALNSIYSMYSAKPYANPIFRKAETSAAAATRLRTGGISYGVGHYVSAQNDLTRLNGYAIADVFRQAQRDAFMAMGNVVGYFIGRGSSYPCSLCDDFVGYTPAMYAELPPYHANCKCWAVPVTDTTLNGLL